MNTPATRLLVLTALMSPVGLAWGAAPADKCFMNLPAGCFVKRSFVVPRDQAVAIGRKLGADIKKLSNTYLSIHGESIQVNIIEAASDTGAARLHQVVSGMKGHPAFCLRHGNRVIEYVGDDPALATKASFELGFLPKPKQVRYRLIAHVATVDKADYMSFNKLFNLFLTTDTRNPSTQARASIARLARRFQFGKEITLRTSNPGERASTYRFSPPQTAAKDASHSEAVTYSFDNPPEVLGVPYVTLEAEIATDETGVTPTTRKGGKELLAATEFWPADDPEIVALAEKIISRQAGPAAKVKAILEWLTPGRNIKFGGPVTGSRWGVKRVLKQKYGQCWDFADCFVTLCRASGVPCRQVGGWLYGGSGHIWAEVLIEGKGWRQVDPTGGGKLRCSIYHIPYFTTETGDMPILYVSMPTIEILKTE